MTSAARAMADRKTFGHLSCLVATRLQSLSLPNMISMRFRSLYLRLSYFFGVCRFFRPGMRTRFWPDLMRALTMVTSFRATAMMTTLCGLPASRKRTAKFFEIGLWWLATRAAWNIACLSSLRPLAMARFPRIAPLSCAIGVRPESRPSLFPNASSGLPPDQTILYQHQVSLRHNTLN